MKLLLDTHAFLWWLADSPRLGPDARAAIGNANNLVFVSAASAWEISVKRANGKLDAPGDVADLIGRNGFEGLAIEVAHAVAAGELPRHHSDPFDRILVAQARLEELRLVADNPWIARYDADILPANV